MALALLRMRKKRRSGRFGFRALHLPELGLHQRDFIFRPTIIHVLAP
jgi:hypothetical protein